MSESQIIIGQRILRTPVLREWESPTSEVAERWRDELVGRGIRADIVYKWSGIKQTIIVQFWEYID